MTPKECAKEQLDNHDQTPDGASPFRRVARDAVFCISLANLALLHVSLSLNSPHLINFRKSPLSLATQLDGLAAGLSAILLLAAAFWLVLSILRRSGTRAAQLAGNAGVLLVLVLAFNTFRSENELVLLSDNSFFFSPAVAIPLLGAFSTGLFAFFRWRTWITRIAAAAVLCLSPLLALTTGTAVWNMLNPTPASALVDGQLAPLLDTTSHPPRQRIVWMIFDELDQQFVFVRRPHRISLPEFDSLRNRSLHADAVRRAALMTREAIPSLVFGRTVRTVKNGEPPDLLLKFHDARRYQTWRESPTIFSEARSLGWNSAIAGWYYPYCRAFSHQVSACMWQPALSRVDEEVPKEMPLARHITLLLGRTAQYFPFAVRLGITKVQGRYRDIPRERRDQLAEFHAVHKSAMTYLVDRRFDFVLIHWPVPHFPGIFNCKTGRLLATEEAGNYVDNLCLADRVLAETREALERAGLWDSTTLLVSADHSLREPEFDAGMKAPLSPLVPFLLKVRGDDSSVPYRQSFSSVVSKDLLLDIMRGRVRSNAEAAAWLDRNRAHASACNDCGW